ncbi:MAG: aromatic ring-hydroxylating dioxygenase subunit alpha [Pseudomonadota bacterium]
MDTETWKPIVKEIFEHIDSGKPWIKEAASVPADAYRSKDRRTAEQNMIESMPQVVGLSADLPEVGSYFTRDNMSIPLVVMRGKDGVARGFANVCVHRCATVVRDGRGCRKKHTCHYHGWTYGNNGKLIGVPSREYFPDIKVGIDGLTELPTFEKHGVIWVILRPAPGANNEAPDLGSFGKDFEALDVPGQEHWESQRFELNMNWKLVMDTFMETYHVSALHPKTAGPVFMANLYLSEQQGPHLRHVSVRHSIKKFKETPLSEWNPTDHTTLMYVLFPNSILTYNKDHVETWRILPHPTDPSKSTADFDFYIPAGARSESATRHWELSSKLLINTIEEEDFVAMEGVQKGIDSGVIDELQIGANEAGLSMYHSALKGALEAAA